MRRDAVSENPRNMVVKIMYVVSQNFIEYSEKAFCQDDLNVSCVSLLSLTDV